MPEKPETPTIENETGNSGGAEKTEALATPESAVKAAGNEAGTFATEVENVVAQIEKKSPDTSFAIKVGAVASRAKERILDAVDAFRHDVGMDPDYARMARDKPDKLPFYVIQRIADALEGQRGNESVIINKSPLVDNTIRNAHVIEIKGNTRLEEILAEYRRKQEEIAKGHRKENEDKAVRDAQIGAQRAEQARKNSESARIWRERKEREGEERRAAEKRRRDEVLEELGRKNAEYNDKVAMRIEREIYEMAKTGDMDGAVGRRKEYENNRVEGFRGEYGRLTKEREQAREKIRQEELEEIEKRKGPRHPEYVRSLYS